VTSKRGVRLGSIDVLQYEGRGLHLGNRLAEHIAVDHLDDYLISIPLDVHVDFEQTGCRGSVEPGAFALLSTSMPFMASISGRQQQGVFSGLNIRISGAALRRRLPTVDRCCGRPIQTRSGAGMIMRRMCEMAI